MNPILIIKAGRTFPALANQLGDFEHWTRQEMQRPPHGVWVVDVEAGEELPEPETVAGAVITGSHAMVTDEDAWMQSSLAWLQSAVEKNLPILGICFGHQLLAQALGGRADWNSAGREIGTTEIILTESGHQDPLLGQLPARFPAHVTHRQSAVELPPGAVLLATSAGDPHQAFRLGPAWGVQFHPEFPTAALRFYIDTLAEELAAEGLDPQRLAAGIRATPDANRLLARFAAYVEAKTVGTR